MIQSPTAVSRGRAGLATVSFVLAALVMLATSLGAAQARSLQLHSAAWGRAHYTGVRGTLGPSAAEALKRGYLVPDQRAYARQKSAATERALGQRVAAASSAAPRTAAPSTLRGFEGLAMQDSAPSDSTSAVGTTRFIELVNTSAAFFTKAGSTPTATASLNDLVGAGSLDSVFDPQIIWDPTTKRFYYAADWIVSGTDNRIAFGFSKSASPSGAGGFCKYYVGYGTSFPDYPKLGDSRDFLLIGVNTFSNNGQTGTFLGSDLIALTKPANGAITTCPQASTIGVDARLNLKMAGGTTPAFTPVPAQEVDTSGTGWAVARSVSLPGTALGLFKVTRRADGSAKIRSTATNVSVPSFNVPADAPQSGTANVIDTADARLTQAVAAVDPAHSSKLNIWTQHAIAGGAGSMERWYEINPGAATITQKGAATSPSLYVFNGSISPNRIVNGSTAAGGGSMVLQFSTSSSATFPAVRMVSKKGANAQSAFALVRSSTTFEDDFTCSPCRWGDYSAATPDPNPSSGSPIWITNQYTGPSGDWASWNAVVAP